MQKRERRLCVCVCAHTHVCHAHRCMGLCMWGGGDTLQTLQNVGKCEVCLWNRMESHDLQQKAMHLRGGRGDETGKGGYGYHG